MTGVAKRYFDYKMALDILAQLGGQPYAMAAISEGHCPLCHRRLATGTTSSSRDAGGFRRPCCLLADLDQIPGRIAWGVCNPCAVVWEIGDDRGHEWLALHDTLLDVNRRLVLNDPTADENMGAQHDERKEAEAARAVVADDEGDLA